MGWLDGLFGITSILKDNVAKTFRQALDFTGDNITLTVESDRITVAVDEATIGGSGGWEPFEAGVDFETTAPDDETITLLSRSFRETLRVGSPVRVWSSDVNQATVFDDSSILGGWGVTGVAREHTDRWGFMWLLQVDDGAGYYHLELYNHRDMTVDKLIAHTATYNSTGAKTLIEDAGSGLGGTVTIGTLTAGYVFVGFYSYHLVREHTPLYGVPYTGITLDGPPLPLGAGAIEGFEIGSVANVRTIYVNATTIDTGGTSTLLAYMGTPRYLREGAPAYVVRLGAWLRTAASTYGQFNVLTPDGAVLSDNGNAGIEVGASDTWVWSTNTVRPGKYAAFDSKLEASVTACDAANEGLCLAIQYVTDDNNLWEDPS